MSIPRRRWLRRCLVLTVLLAGAGTLMLLWLAHDLPSPRAALAAGAAQGPTARIYDRNGNLLFEVLPPGDEAGKRDPLPLEHFPEALREATIATEDAAFYQHPGIDWRGILRALRRNWREWEVAAGGSTITQQVARMVFLPAEERHERSLRRKLREAILAIRLEREFSKEEILALYLNHVYYGNLAYGAGAASQSYFGKEVWELSPAEAALLAGLPQAPALYNPLTDPDAASARQQDVLRLMTENGYLSPSEAELAGQERLRFAATNFPIEAPHFVMWVVEELDRRYGARLVDGSGLRVTTTLDLGLQDLAQSIVTRRLGQLQNRQGDGLDRNVHNAALVALDPLTGDVLAMIGSPDYFDASIDGAVNVALMPRQPGSALKPITYATAFDPSRTGNNPWSPATVVSDVPTTFRTQDGKLYAPENYDLTFHGPIPLRQALATSSNIVAVKVLEHVGIEAMLQTARDLGIRSLTDPKRYYLTVTLGGGEVTLLE
nr:transglycosylase domain-containing protein [Ardenticatenales bacterium]